LARLSFGFTLIELLVVLSVVSTLGALVGPNLWGSYQRSSEKTVVYDYAYRLKAASRGVAVGVSYGLDELSDRAAEGQFSLPTGWVMESNTPLYFMPSGVTNGAQLVFLSPTQQRWKLVLKALVGSPWVETL